MKHNMKDKTLLTIIAVVISFIGLTTAKAQEKNYKDDFYAGQVLPFDTASVNQYIREGWVSYKFESTPQTWPYEEARYYQIYNYANNQNATLRIKNVSNITISLRCVSKTVGNLSPIYLNENAVANSNRYQWTVRTNHNFTFNIPTPEDVSTITVNSSNKGIRIIITKITINSVTRPVTIQEGFKRTSFSANTAIDFSKTDGLTAYVVTSADGKVAEVFNAPANTGVILEGDPGTYTLYSTTKPDTPETNLLVGTVLNPYTVQEGDNVYGYGQYEDKGEGFFHLATGYEISAGKAYLKVDASAAAKEFIPFDGEDNATGISSVDAGKPTVNAPLYNLAGQRVTETYKGVVISNGRKYVHK